MSKEQISHLSPPERKCAQLSLHSKVTDVEVLGLESWGDVIGIENLTLVDHQGTWRTSTTHFDEPSTLLVSDNLRHHLAFV